MGGAVTTRWREGLKNIDDILNHRYAFLRKLEQNPTMVALGASVYSDEWKAIYERRKDRKYRSVTSRLQVTFLTVFILIPVLLAALTAVETIPAIHALVPPTILHYIHPIIQAK